MWLQCLSMSIVLLVELYAKCTAVYLTHPFNSTSGRNDDACAQ
jgi:hypothetical protein